MNAPPDVLALAGDESGDGGRPRALSRLHALRKKKRLFVCGLALDFCVLDTCLNARELGFEEVWIVLDAARAARIPGVGAHGTGFLSSPPCASSKQAGTPRCASWLAASLGKDGDRSAPFEQRRRSCPRRPTRQRSSRSSSGRSA